MVDGTENETGHLEAVLFDLDGTLLDRRLSFERFVRDQWRRFPALLQSSDQELFVRSAIACDDDGYAPRRHLFSGALARCGLATDAAEALLADYRARFPSACVLFPDATHTLSALRAMGLKLGLITNGSARMQSGKIAHLALRPVFDTLLISDEEGICKPEPEIFRRALARLDTEPECAAFVGDLPDVDIAGARRAGMTAVWRRDAARAQQVDADVIIDELTELIPWATARRRR